MQQRALRSLFLAFEHANAHRRRSMSLGVNEFLVLFHLWMRDQPMTMGDMARLVNVTTGGLTSLVERLERDAYLRREPDPVDRRRTNLVLTQSGRSAREDFLTDIRAAEDRLSRLPEAHRNAVGDFLDQVSQSLEQQSANRS
jgi:DNA-binding MarR family transcriptional regulator